MSARPPPLVPNSLPLSEALQRSAPLALLRQRLQDSNARFRAIQTCLPGALAAHVKPGPVDEQGWTLLAANAAVAAKLRQLEPRIERVLQDAGWPPGAIRIKVQAG